MSSCVKCDREIPKKEVLVCCVCKGSFHAECTRMDSIENFKKLSSQRRAIWSCDECKSPAEERNKTESAIILEHMKSMRNDLSAQISGVNLNVDGIREEMKNVKDAIASIESTLGTLKTENEARKKEFRQVKQDQGKFEQEMAKVEERVREMEQYSRRDNVELIGVPSSKGEDILAIIEKVSQTIGVKYDRWQISTAHRLQATTERPNPAIIIRFITRDYRSAWINAARVNRRKLTATELSDSWPSTPLYVNEHLTPYYKAILARARRMVKEKRLAFAWTRDCRVYARRTADQDCPAALLRSMDDLDRLLNNR